MWLLHRLCPATGGSCRNKVKGTRKTELGSVDILAADRAWKAIYCPAPVVKDRTFVCKKGTGRFLCFQACDERAD